MAAPWPMQQTESNLNGGAGGELRKVLTFSLGSEFIEGIATADEQMLILVDAQRLASNDSPSSSSSQTARAA